MTGRIATARCFVLLMTATVPLISCTESGADAADPPGQVVASKSPRELARRVTEDEFATLMSGQRTFAFDLYEKLRPEPGNLFFSPYSVSSALAMTYAGARGATATQMAAALHFDLPPEQLHPAMNELDQKLTLLGSIGRKPDTGFKLSISNRLWGQTGYVFRPEFLDLLAREYGASLSLFDFAKEPAEAAKSINAWVSQATQGRIQNLIAPDSLSADTRLVLTNAIYFRARWQSEFDEKNTQPRPFTLLDGAQIDVPTMRKQEWLRYATGDGYQAVALPYEPDRVAMIIVLPDAGRCAEMEKAFTAARFADIEAALKNRDIMLELPKFEFVSRFNLGTALAALGMPLAFDSGRADFTGMTDSTPPLFIGRVVHQAFIKIDEKETEAAAATAVEMRELKVVEPTAPLELKVDRPFLFVIRDAKTQAILFAGRVVDPRPIPQ